eukprot:CCRYP_010731-RA/>CCRYP_010731-RA protein AED:0.60 eAED:0.41 QI:0/0/0/0.5/1/1/2/0/122
MQAKLDALKDSVMEEMKCEMEKRGFASTECNTKKITDAIDGLGKMLERITAVGGANSAENAERGDSTSVDHYASFVVEDEGELVDLPQSSSSGMFTLVVRNATAVWISRLTLVPTYNNCATV